MPRFNATKRASIAELQGEFDRRFPSASALDLARLCFAPQLRALTSPAKGKVLICGRRAGKTYGLALAALNAARSRMSVLYVTLTRANGKEIIWPDLLALNEAYHLGGQVNLTDLSMEFPNGGSIRLRGANNDREIAKFRGKKFHIVFIDEAQSIPDRIIRPLITEILSPALMDYDGSLWLIGTRPPIRAGYFWEQFAGKGAGRWDIHSWTVRDNTMFPALLGGKSIDQILSDIRERNGWTDTDPSYRREILCEDVEDTESLLFGYNPQANDYGSPPSGKWTYVFGMDLGHEDSDAIAVLGWPEHDKRVYLVEEYVQDREDVTDFAAAATRLSDKYSPIRMVIDQGGLGKKIAVELQRRHGLGVEPADKTQKGAYIRLLNTALRKGELLARSDSRFADDCKLVQRDAKALLRGELRERPRGEGGYHSDICDAVLYGWRACVAYFESEAPKPKPVDEVLFEARVERMEREAARPWWENAGKDLGFED